MFLLWPLLFLYCLHIFANDLDMFLPQPLLFFSVFCNVQTFLQRISIYFFPDSFYFFYFLQFLHFQFLQRIWIQLSAGNFNFFSFLQFLPILGYVSPLATFIFPVFGQLHFLICCVFLRKENDAHRLLTRLTPGVKKKYAPVVSLWMEQSLV